MTLLVDALLVSSVCAMWAEHLWGLHWAPLVPAFVFLFIVLGTVGCDSVVWFGYVVASVAGQVRAVGRALVVAEMNQRD